MKKVIILVILSLLLVGCSGAVPQVIEPEPVVEVDPGPVAEKAVEIVQAAKTEQATEPEPVAEKEVEMSKAEKNRVVYKEPEPSITPEPFVAAELDLEMSTAKELIIGINYYDSDGNKTTFDRSSLSCDVFLVYVEVWNEMPPAIEKDRASYDESWWLARLLFGHATPWLNKSSWDVGPSFEIHSSEDAIVIPVGSIKHCDPNELYIQVYFQVAMHGIYFESNVVVDMFNRTW